jgi:hypothetical protein
MTKKPQSVSVMPVPDLVRDDGSGIQSIMALSCPNKSLNLGLIWIESYLPKHLFAFFEVIQ